MKRSASLISHYINFPRAWCDDHAATAAAAFTLSRSFCLLTFLFLSFSCLFRSCSFRDASPGITDASYHGLFTIFFSFQRSLFAFFFSCFPSLSFSCARSNRGLTSRARNQSRRRRNLRRDLSRNQSEQLATDISTRDSTEAGLN